MKIIAYIGPSISIEEAQGLLPGGIFRPPAKQSDILSDVINNSPDAIVLIDGEFHQNLSVWHKEILFALSKGVHVLGASSMGALRAVECEAFGMEGTGVVFEWYKSQTVSADDEVALAYDSDFNPLSIPLIEVRFTLERMQMGGKITNKDAQEILDKFHSLYYPDRTIEAIPKKYQDDFRKYRSNAKNDDAKVALALARARASTVYSNPFKPSFELSGSHLFEAQIERDRWSESEGEKVRMSEIEAWAALNDPDFPLDNWNAANRQAALLLCSILGILPTKEQEEVEKQRWNVEGDVMGRLAYENASIRQLHRTIRSSFVMRRNTDCYLKHAKMIGKFNHLLEEAATSKAIVNRLCPDFIQREIRTPTQEEIKSILPDGCDLKSFMEETGIISQEELNIELEKRNIASGA